MGGVTTNTQPDVFIWGYDVNTQYYTNPVNVTALTDYWGENYWLHVGDMVLTEGTDYYIPVSTSQNGVTEDDPVTHKYFKGPGFNEAEFVNPGAGNHTLPVKSLVVAQNYPNPFNGTSMVGVTLARACSLSLEVYNLIGQKVYEVPARNVQAGKYNMVINSNGLRSGIYTYSVIAGGEKVTRKMVVK
ncbi:MAG: T9SS type A sorting domain-containing protein [Bacteroidales bacterium]|nr:T9SS type A sorting domain-containing protein [Bacteroidales bacterium]